MQFTGLSREEASAFAGPWLAAWSEGPADRLCAFYTADAFYSDLLVPEGIVGSEELAVHFGTLLETYPGWVWRHVRATPLAGGFLNHWQASVPRGGRVVDIHGVCTVQLRDGLIERNEVFFDPSPLTAR